METMAFLGASRGLGRAVTVEMGKQDSLGRALLVSRKWELLQDLEKSLTAESDILGLDFSNGESLPQLFHFLLEKRPQRVFYFAGGGPYGKFGDKSWKDHQWGLQVSFFTPAQLLHQVLHSKEFDFVQQIVFIGSRIADDQADPKAASYAAAKHALKGLVESVLAEGTAKDVRLFRPGYMRTELLPKASELHQGGAEVAEPSKIAGDFVRWVLDPQGPPIFDAFA